MEQFGLASARLLWLQLANGISGIFPDNRIPSTVLPSACIGPDASYSVLASTRLCHKSLNASHFRLLKYVQVTLSYNETMKSSNVQKP
jgi:hypothetical protein